MKALTYTEAVLLILLGLSEAKAAQITNRLDDIPAQVQCGQTWTNQDVILRFTETVASEDHGFGGYCSFSAGYRFVELWPCRLALDFTLLDQPVVGIEVDIYDESGPSQSKLFAYHGGSQIASVANPASGNQTLALDLKAVSPDACAIRSFQAFVDQIRIRTEDRPPPMLSIQAAGGLFTVSWPTNCGPFALEKAASLAPSLGWTPQTNSVQLQGSNFTYRIISPDGSQFFRLRRN